MNEKMKTKLSIILIPFVVFSIITAFAIFGNRLENISYDFIKRNLWIAIPIIGIGYIIFDKTQENLIGFFTNLTSTKKVFSDAQEIPSIKGENSSINNFIISFNGRCYNCKKSVLTDFINDEIKLGDVLKCRNCGALNKNTYPTKIIYAPGFIVGGLVFFSEWLGDKEHQIMFVVIILSVFASFIVSRFWTNNEFIPDKTIND